MTEFIKSPFYSVKNNNLIYLNKFKICELPQEQSIRQKILENEGVILYKNKLNRTEKNKSILVLEPHPDDFALSALGYIDNKKNVIVLNIFSRMNLDSFTWNDRILITEDDYEKIRLKEDKIAIENILGQQVISLKEKSTRITDKSINYINDKIIKKLEKIMINYKNIDTLMIPMGIGMHPDHVIVYNAIMKNYIVNLDKKVKIILYPEYPYARCKKFYIDRLKQIENQCTLKIITKNINDKINNIVNSISVYKSQFDDINKNQMLAIIREDGKAIAEEYNQKNISLVYYEVKR